MTGIDISHVPLTAAERRERRIKKILEASEARMNSILAGPNGTENRLAPSLEGGEPTKLPLNSEPLLDSGDLYLPNPTASKTSKPSPAGPQRTMFLPDRLRLAIVIIIGIISRFILLNGLEMNMILPWTVLFFATEWFFNRSDVRVLPMQAEIIAMLGVFGVREHFVTNTVFFVSALRRYISDTMCFIGGFLLTHLFLTISPDYQLFKA